MTKKGTINLYIFSDLFFSSIAWILFFFFRKKYIEHFPFEIDGNFILGIILMPIFWFFLTWMIGGYENPFRKYRIKEFSSTIISTFLGTIIVFFLLILDDHIYQYSDYYISFIAFFGINFLLIFIPRLLIVNRIVKKIHRGEIGFKTLIIGGSEKALELYQEFEDLKTKTGNQFVGFLKTNGNDSILEKKIPQLGTKYDIHSTITEQDIEEIIIAIESTEHQSLNFILNELEGYSLVVKTIPDMYDILSGKVKMNNLFGIPLAEIKSEYMPSWQKRMKRIIDVSASLFAITILSPVYIGLYIAVKSGSKGPAFFSQKRVGLHGVEFTIFKYRSMYIDAEKNGPQLSSDHDKRITKIGRLLRKTRLDEIPQFYNVLIGDMSLVGPRPERQFFINQIVKEAPYYKHLHKVRPGITSWGQVKYGYAENVPQMVQRLKYDILYIKNMSLALDFKILFFTIITVIKSKGK